MDGTFTYFAQETILFGKVYLNSSFVLASDLYEIHPLRFGLGS